MNMTPEQLEQWKDACDALRDGEEIEYQASDMSWWPTTTISRCYLHRRKPIAPPRMVPLTRADVPLHSVFRAPSNCDFLPVQVSDQGIRFSILNEAGKRSWSELQNLGWLIHRPGDNNQDGSPAWRKCEKPEEAK